MEENKTKAQQIEEFAQLQFTDDEIAQIMETDVSDLTAEFAANIDRGRLLAEAEVRKSILQMAKQGSTPAQKQLMELNKQAKKTARRYK